MSGGPGQAAWAGSLANVPEDAGQAEQAPYQACNRPASPAAWSSCLAHQPACTHPRTHLLLLLPGRQCSVHDAVRQVDLLPELARPPLHLKLRKQHRLQHLVVLHVLRQLEQRGRQEAERGGGGLSIVRCGQGCSGSEGTLQGEWLCAFIARMVARVPWQHTTAGGTGCAAHLEVAVRLQVHKALHQALEGVAVRGLQCAGW